MKSILDRFTCGTINSRPSVPRRLVTALLLCACALPAVAQPTPPKKAAPAQTAAATAGTTAVPSSLRVATRLVTPFVTDVGGGKLDGFSIALWNKIADNLNTHSTFVVKPTVKDLLDTVGSKQADLGIAAISVTSERDKSFDFSQPIFDSGLQILVRDQSSGGGAMPSFFAVFFTPTMLQLFGIVLLMILIPAHLVWLFERNREDGLIENKRYFPGIFKALWWSAGTLGAQADEMPKSPFGRLIALMWMFLGIAFVAYFTATVTAGMTVSQLQGNIQGPDDLPGKKVATTLGSTSAAYLREKKANVQEFPSFDAAVQALEDKNNHIDAVVFDAPVLLYYAAHDGKDKVQVVGSVFRKESYGIVFPPNSPLRKPVNNALLSIKEDGTYDDLYTKWFGTEGGGS